MNKLQRIIAIVFLLFLFFNVLFPPRTNFRFSHQLTDEYRATVPVRACVMSKNFYEFKFTPVVKGQGLNLLQSSDVISGPVQEWIHGQADLDINRLVATSVAWGAFALMLIFAAGFVPPRHILDWIESWGEGTTEQESEVEEKPGEES